MPEQALIDSIIMRTGYASYPVHWPRIRFILGRLAGLMEGGASVRVLDYGCGTGMISWAAAELGCRVTAFDVDPGSVDFAREHNGHERVTWTSEPISGLGRSFDAVILTEVLEHTRNPREMLEDAGKALVPGGRLLLTVPNGFGPSQIADLPAQLLLRLNFTGFLARARGLVGKEKPYSCNVGSPHYQFFSRGRLHRLLEEAGFSISRFETGHFLLGIPNQYLPFIHLPVSWAEADFRAARKVPFWLASGFHLEAARP